MSKYLSYLKSYKVINNFDIVINWTKMLNMFFLSILTSEYSQTPGRLVQIQHCLAPGSSEPFQNGKGWSVAGSFILAHYHLTQRISGFICRMSVPSIPWYSPPAASWPYIKSKSDLFRALFTWERTDLENSLPWVLEMDSGNFWGLEHSLEGSPGSRWTHPHDS